MCKDTAEKVLLTISYSEKNMYHWHFTVNWAVVEKIRTQKTLIVMRMGVVLQWELVRKYQNGIDL